jgi:hypothetical protein
MNLPVLCISLKWNHVMCVCMCVHCVYVCLWCVCVYVCVHVYLCVCDLFHLGWCVQVRWYCSMSSILHSFLWQNSIPLYVETLFSLSIHHSVGISLFLPFRYCEQSSYKHCVQYFLKYFLSIILGIGPGGELLSNMITLCLIYHLYSQ